MANTRIGPGDLRSREEIREAIEHHDEISRQYTPPDRESAPMKRGEARHVIEDVVDRVLNLSREEQFRLLRDVLPRVTEEMDPHQKDSYLRELLHEVERARRGASTYDIRESMSPEQR
jgi:hypothetical protein